MLATAAAGAGAMPTAAVGTCTADAHRYANQFMDNSPTDQLAEIDIMTFRLTPKRNGNYESSAHLLNRQI